MQWSGPRKIQRSWTTLTIRSQRPLLKRAVLGYSRPSESFPLPICISFVFSGLILHQMVLIQISISSRFWESIELLCLGQKKGRDSWKPSTYLWQYNPYCLKMSLTWLSPVGFSMWGEGQYPVPISRNEWNHVQWLSPPRHSCVNSTSSSYVSKTTERTISISKDYSVPAHRPENSSLCDKTPIPVPCLGLKHGWWRTQKPEGFRCC